MRTTSPARCRAISIESVRRRSMPGFTIRRSTTMSIEWLRRRSSAMSSSRDRIWPSTRALRNPRWRHAARSFLNSPLRPRTTGARTLIRSVVRIRHQLRHDLVRGLRRDREAAARAVRDADVREEQAEVVVDLRHRPDRRPRVGARRLLLDRQGRRQALDRVDVRLLHLLEELAGVGRERLDVAALSLGVDRVEGERRLAGSRQPRDDHELVARQVHVDPFQVVDARAADGDLAGTHAANESALGIRGSGLGMEVDASASTCPMPHVPCRPFQPLPKHEILPCGGL